LDRLAAGWRLFVFLRYLFIPELPSLGAMRRTIIIYGLSMAALLGMLKYFEYQYFVRDMSIEFYVGAVAIMFTAIGIWAGLRLTRPTIKIIDNSIPFEADNLAIQKLGLSKREYEVLELIAAGHSNQEIADKLFISMSTVKTHVSNVLAKLDANRRTEAIARAKKMRIIP
jgi:DNA-binding CsgD family transcriptional regulator